MIGVSAGTATVLGLEKARCDVAPTVAYFMLGRKCAMNCTFCAQSRHSSARAHFLSRVAWPGYPVRDAFRRLSEDRGDFHKACFQIVNRPGIIDAVKRVIDTLRQFSTIKVGICCNCLTDRTISELFDTPIDTIAIPLDAATPALYGEIKGGDMNRSLDLLMGASLQHPGKIATHLMAGLGETEEEMVRLLELLCGHGITVGLFAFTPVHGTPLEGKSPPELGSYRRIQAAHYLIRNKIPWRFQFKKGKLFFGENCHELRSLMGGEPFETSGCPGCNRPYYNERPGQIPFNYPRGLSDEEIREAFEVLVSGQSGAGSRQAAECAACDHTYEKDE